MTTNKGKRLRWFDRGASALHHYDPRFSVTYICPFCETEFERDAAADGRLTADHAPARAVGGREVALTCQRCNSAAGTKLESQVVQRERVRRFVAGSLDAPMRVQISTDGGTLAAQALHDSRGFLVTGVKRATSPQDFSGMMQYLESREGTDQWNFELQMRAGNPRLAALADLRSAYLVAFAALGYRYALHKRLAVVRQQLITPEKTLIANFALTIPAAPDSVRCLAVARRPFRFVCVQMGMAAVVLPWMTGRTQVYERFAGLARSGERTSFRGVEVPWPREPQMLLDFHPELRASL